MKKVFLALAVTMVAGSSAMAFPFWHHRHHRHHRYSYTPAPADPRNPGGIFNGH